MIITGLYLLVFAFTIAKCEHVLEKKQDHGPPDVDPFCLNPSPDLLDCINSYATPVSDDSRYLCDPDSTFSVCRCQLEDFIERCADDAALQSFREDYEARCGTATPCNDDVEGPGVPVDPEGPSDPENPSNGGIVIPSIVFTCLISYHDPDLQDCLNANTNSDGDTFCTSTCEDLLWNYVLRCSYDPSIFRELYNSLCH